MTGRRMMNSGYGMGYGMVMPPEMFREAMRQKQGGVAVELGIRKMVEEHDSEMDSWVDALIDAMNENNSGEVKAIIIRMGPNKSRLDAYYTKRTKGRNLRSDIRKNCDSELGKTVKSGATGASIGAVVGFFCGGPPGAIVGAVIGGVFGGLLGAFGFNVGQGNFSPTADQIINDCLNRKDQSHGVSGGW